MTYALNASPEREATRIFGACKIAYKAHDQEAYNDLFESLCKIADLGVVRAADYVDTLELYAAGPEWTGR